MRTLADNSVDSVVTDPPYGLAFMGKRWDHGVPSVEVWAESLRLLKPGGYLLAFGGTRTYHRMVCAIEDAGFEIRDQIGWAFGSGFPKSHNGPWGGTALKPAWEPICVARKPLIGTVEANWQEHGTGALNIDGCRVGTNGEQPKGSGDRRGGSVYAQDEWTRTKMANGGNITPEAGRWPANLIHDGSDEVVALFPQSSGQSGAITGKEPTANGFSGVVYGYGGIAKRAAMEPRGDSGSAARFFYCAKADRADRNEGLHNMPERLFGMSNAAAAAARGEHYDNGDGGVNRVTKRQNHHPTVKPTDIMRYLCRLVTPAGGVVLDPFMGSGSTGRGAVLEGFRFIGIEREAEYIEIAQARIDSARRQGHQPDLLQEAA